MASIQERVMMARIRYMLLFSAFLGFFVYLVFNDPLLANHSSLTIDTSEARFLLIPSKPGIGKADFRVTGPVPEPL